LKRKGERKIDIGEGVGKTQIEEEREKGEVCVRVCVCVREREKKRERETEFQSSTMEGHEVKMFVPMMKFSKNNPQKLIQL
jgi:hypothetical protein